MQTLSKIVRYSFFLVFTIMFLFAAGLWVKCIYNPVYLKEFIFGLGISGCFIWLIVMAARGEDRNLYECRIQNYYIPALLIMLMAFLLRCVSINIMRTVQISDFNFPNVAIHALSEGTDAAMLNYLKDYYSRYPAWFPYMKLVNSFYKLFCKGEINVEAIKYLNAILNTLTCGGVCYISRLFFSERVALTAELLYACSPSLILWVNIMSPDHVVMILLVAQAVVWYWMWENRGKNRVFILLVLFHTIACVFINWFKPLVILFWFVFVIFSLGSGLIKEKRHLVRVLVVYTISFMVSFCVSSKILTAWVESYTQEQVEDSTWQYIYAGLVMDANGKMDNGRASEEIGRVMAEYGDIEKQMQVFKEMVQEEISLNITKLPVLVVDKYREAVSHEGATWYWTNTCEENKYNAKLDEVLSIPYYFYANGYYFWILIAVAFCGISQLFSNYRNANVMMPALVIAGFLAIQLLTVVQGRYKLILMPLYVTLAANGVVEIKIIRCNIQEKSDMIGLKMVWLEKIKRKSEK